VACSHNPGGSRFAQLRLLLLVGWLAAPWWCADAAAAYLHTVTGAVWRCQSALSNSCKVQLPLTCPDGQFSTAASSCRLTSFMIRTCAKTSDL
jgi:hypothetical protein